MTSINEGFVNDDGNKKSELESPRYVTAEPQTRMQDIEIDYSKAKNAPIIGAALSGK